MWRMEIPLCKSSFGTSFSRRNRRGEEHLKKMFKEQKCLIWDTNANGVNKGMRVNNSTNEKWIDWFSLYLLWHLRWFEVRTREVVKLWKSRMTWVLRNARICKWRRYDESKRKSVGLFQMKRPFWNYGICFDQSSATKAWKERKCELRFGDQIFIRMRGCNTPYLIIPIKKGY